MTDEAAEVRGDIAELRQLIESATRPSVRNDLSLLIRKRESNLSALTTANVPADDDSSKPKPQQRRVVKIVHYGWDQSNSNLSIYLTDERLKGVEKLPKDRFKCSFSSSGVVLRVENHGDASYVFEMSNLARPIDTSASSFRVKTGMIVISFRKQRPGQWEAVSATEQAIKEREKSKFDSKKGDGSDDVSGNIMGLMKKMYDDGDDEMKRTIRKAWTESQDKQRLGQSGAMDMGGGMGDL